MNAKPIDDNSDHTNKTNSEITDRPPVARLSVEFDMPQEIANCFVMANENETRQMIEAVCEYLYSKIGEHNRIVEENRKLRRAESVVTIRGEKLTLTELCQKTGLTKNTMRRKIRSLIE